MQRLVAGLALFAFLGACSDSTSTAPRQVQPSGTALHISDPPPPPLSGDGRGDINAFTPEIGLTASTINTAPPSSCFLSAQFLNATYSFKYLVNNTMTNEMAHMDFTGNVTGQATIHDMLLGNGKTNLTGRVQNADYILDITDGSGQIFAVVHPATGETPAFVTGTFVYSLTGMLTEVATGKKCSVTGSFDGSFTPNTD